jgi:hypothetical protein
MSPKGRNGNQNQYIEKMKTRFKTWKKIRIGNNLKSFEEFEKASKKKGVHIYNREKIRDIVNSPTFNFSEEEKDVELVMIEMFDQNELGIPESRVQNMSMTDLILFANNMGLEECPPETGLQLRLQSLHDYPSSGGVLIGMRPIFGKTLQVWTQRDSPDYSDWSQDERPMLTSEEEEKITSYYPAIDTSDSVNPCYWLSRFVFVKSFK